MNGSESTRIAEIMRGDVIRIGMDATLAEAMTVCLQHRIRHLPVVDAKERLVGLVTDRDLRVFISHRLGTVMETNIDRETLHRRVHVMMVRRVVTATPDMTVAEAAQLMLLNHVGCLPIVSATHQLVGIVTTHDLLTLLAEERISQGGAGRSTAQKNTGDRMESEREPRAKADSGAVMAGESASTRG